MGYFADSGGEPAMAEEDALELWRRACELGDAADRDRLAENFRPVIASEAARLAAGPARGDLAAWGWLGLLRALCCYRPDSPIGFYDFCRRRVRETMRDEIRASAHTPGAPSAGIGGVGEVARLWGEISREFSSPATGGPARTRVATRRREAFRAGALRS